MLRETVISTYYIFPPRENRRYILFRVSFFENHTQTPHVLFPKSPMAMATLCNFITFHSLSSRKVLVFSCPLPLKNSHINNNHQSTVLASTFKKPPSRTGKKVKSNEDLCSDIREFLSSVGLQDNHVPSIKELSQNGRQDLANIVRRRGYKFISQLLQTSTLTNIDTFQSENLESLTGSEGQKEKIYSLADDEYSSEAIQVVDTMLNDQRSLPSDTTLTLQEKIAKFIQHGELDTVEDSGFGDAETLNGSVLSSIQKVEDSLLDNISSSRNSYISTEEQNSVDSCKDLDAENMENEAEVKHLKFMLHQKEMELTRLKQQIENEKLALSVLQTKAETELSKAQKLVSEKETELLAAEESLSGLKEVEILYSGDAETVELAGSFNGWDHKIKMDLQSSSITNYPSQSS
ncbi:hypothetical protein ACJIZ3_021895 [Penstemon smallii]|uniref:Uncharacterized protein n=1 Tax=Penstemon smallii TaxID=265156 RepID=A0ABD3SNE7_9LAMI